MADVPRLLADQVRVMRVTPGASIDSHEAYVDAIVLLVPGNPSGTEVGTDDLAVDGVVMPGGERHGCGWWCQVRQVESRAPIASGSAGWAARCCSRDTPQGVALAKRLYLRRKRRRCVCRGRRCMSMVGRFLPRVIQWNGEPLQFLSACGFNVVQLPGAPTPEQSAEAEKLGLWFLCSPEHPDALARRVGASR